MENEIFCPYCAEVNLIEIDLTEGASQTFVHDCEVCCRPIELTISVDRDGNINVDAKDEEGF